MGKVWKIRWWWAVILAIGAIVTSFPSYGAEPAMEKVRVGFFAFDGYHMLDENGVRTGYGYDVLQYLAGYSNLQYEYVGYDKNWNEMQDMLARGEIDILTSAQKTMGRMSQFDFTSSSIGISSAILTVKAGDNRYLLEDYANWQGLRVGMLRGNSRNSNFDSFAKQKGFTYAPVYFDDTDTMVAALQTDTTPKLVDAVLTSNLRQIQGEQILAQFDPSPFYIMVKKGNEALLDKLNNALIQLEVDEPGFRTRLMNKYYTPKSADQIAFTPEERAYIQSMKGKPFTAILNPDRAPYAWQEQGKQQGILYDTALEMVRRSGLDIQFLEVADSKTYWDMVENSTADIRFDMPYNLYAAEQQGYWLTTSYLTVPMAQLHRRDVAQVQTAAFPENPDISQEYAHNLAAQGIASTYYPTLKQTTQAVLEEKQDAAFLPIDTAMMLVRLEDTNRLQAEEVFGAALSYAAGVRHGQNPLLYSVLNRAAASMGDYEFDRIRQNYAHNPPKPFSLLGYFYDYPLQIFMGAVAVLTVAVLLVGYGSLSRRRRLELVHLEKEQSQNELLRAALVAAEKADAAKNQFLSRVSHEMRTPLNAIIGFIELAKDADAETTSNYLASSDIAAKQLLNVINDVLDMSSIQSGKIKIASAKFHFRNLITSITNIYGLQCRQKGIAFETKISEPTEEWLVGDELRLNQILMNLLGNAVKFTEKGHIWLSIAQTEGDKGHINLRFTVTDTGCGIDKDMLSRLFQPFEQESAATARKYGGSGLGLSIVKNLVGMMDGRIDVDSRVGEGTQFVVDLPFQKSDELPTMPLLHEDQQLRVLAVDDEAVDREYMRLVLERMGVRFTCVSGGSEALDALDESQSQQDIYNVCLVDWRMPKMSGYHTVCKIREKYGSDMVVIVVSAYDFHQAEESARAAGANMFLSKPVFQSSLYDLFMNLTNGKISPPVEMPKIRSFAGKRVLLVEDNLLNQIVCKGYLQKCSVVVDVAENGKIAVDTFTASPSGYYDALLMDIQMPVMDGLEAAKAIRQSNHPDAKTVPIIAQTADAFTEDIAKALAAGMNAHMAKPLQPEVLTQTLYHIFYHKDVVIPNPTDHTDPISNPAAGGEAS